MLRDCQLIDADFSRRDAALCFVWAQPFVTDEVRRRVAMVHLDFVGFLEALARITTFKRLPTPQALKECHALTVPHWFQQAANGEHDGVAMLRPIDWHEEEHNTELPLGQPLEALISLLLDRLDPNHDGNVTRRELKRREAMLARFREGA